MVFSPSERMVREPALARGVRGGSDSAHRGTTPDRDRADALASFPACASRTFRAACSCSAETIAAGIGKFDEACCGRASLNACSRSASVIEGGLLLMSSSPGR